MKAWFASFVLFLLPAATALAQAPETPPPSTPPAGSTPPPAEPPAPPVAPAPATETKPPPSPGPANSPPPPAPVPEAPSGNTLSIAGLQLRISGVIYADWQYQFLTPAGKSANGANNFDLTRAYINVEPQLTRNIWLRITPDIARVANDPGNINGSLLLRFKYAFAQFDQVLPGMSVRGGLQQTAYIDWEESIWKYRVLSQIGYETFENEPSADLGVGVLGSTANERIGYQVVLSNGEGYSHPENPAFNSAKFKQLGGRLTLAPFAGGSSDLLKRLMLTGFVQYAFSLDPPGAVGPREQLRTIVLLTWENKHFTLGVGGGPESTALPSGPTAHGNLIEAFGFVNLPWDLRLLARFDRFDPGKPSSVGIQNRYIAGLAYRIVKPVQVILDYQAFNYGNPSAVPATNPGKSVFVHLEAKY